MLMQRIISIDPGYTTGYVIADIDKVGQWWQINSILRADQFKYPNFLEILSMTKNCELIIIEQFITRPNFSGQINYSDRVIGCFEVLHQNKDIIFQQPSQKPLYPDDRLKQMGVWHASLHVRDAYRHLLIYLHSINRSTATFKTRRPK